MSAVDANGAKSGSIARTVAIQDCSFLFGVVLLSGLSYMGRLGFYLDDWGFWGIFYHSKDKSLAGLLRWFWWQDLEVRSRPVQMLYLALTHSTFGLHPLPYHLINTLVLAGAAVLFYLSLRELRLPHCVTLVVPLVYVLLPHYATDRFWIATHQAVLSLAFFFLGLYAGLRAVRSGRTGSLCLQAASILSFAFGLLSYEMTIGMVAASLVLIGYRIRTKHRDNGFELHSSILHGMGYFLIASVSLGLVFLFKMQVDTRFTHHYRPPFLDHMEELVWHGMGQTIRFNVLQYGTGLPRAALTLYRSSGAGAQPAIIAGVIAISVLLYLTWTFRRSRSDLLSIKGTLSLIILGFAVFVLAYLPFLMWFGMLLVTTSIDNRVSIAAGVGPACVLVGGIAVLIRAFIPAQLRVQAFGDAIAIICAMNYICVASFAEYWVKAYIQQGEIISEIRRNVDAPAGSTLLLDGFCRQVGPAIVFKGYYDTGGALQIAYADETLKADMVSPDMEIHDDAVTTILFGYRQRYTYGEKLWVYNVQRKALYRLTDSLVAHKYLQNVDPDSGGCEIDPLPPQPKAFPFRWIFNWLSATIGTTPAKEGGSGGC